MPIFVEWKWVEKTKSLLVIFHFYDDFSKPNLRLLRYDKLAAISLEYKGDVRPLPDEVWITWAPSHTEIALLMELLSYANIINGLKPEEKRMLWIELEGKRNLFDKYGYNQKILFNTANPADIQKEIGLKRKVLVYTDATEKEEPLRTCVELCPEYIGYIKKVLNSYLRK